MSALCDLALAAGLTLSGACQPALPPADPLPADDKEAWSYRPAPVPEPPKPAPVPVMPPVVLKQEVIREVRVEVPASAPPAPAPVVERGPDAIEEAMAVTYRNRAAGNRGVPTVTAALPSSDMAPLGQSLGGPQVPEPSSEYEEKALTSTGRVDNSRIITTDRYVCGVLETATNTQLDGSTGGTVVIQVSRDTFGYHGRNLLVPKGSRLVCGFKSLDKVGSSRSPFRCSRILLGQSRAEIFGLKANAVDVQGHLGMSGDVDHRFAERYGTAFILAGVSAAVRAATATSGTVASSSTSNASGSTSAFSANSGGALSSGGAELSQRLGEITAATLEQTINLLPILRTFQGQRVCIRPDTDWYIAKVE
jgi:type IV secretion system protein VirB10